MQRVPSVLYPWEWESRSWREPTDEGVFSSGSRWGSELTFGQPPSAYDLEVGEGSRGRSSQGDPGAPPTCGCGGPLEAPAHTQALDQAGTGE